MPDWSRNLASQPPEAELISPALPADLIELGVLRGAYGIKGWVRVQPYSQEAAALRANRHWWLLDAAGPMRLEVTGLRRHGAQVVVKWQGCDTPEQADRLRGTKVGLARAQFPPAEEGEVYWVDLIGARVVNRSGVDLGMVSGLRSNGAQELLEVQLADGVLLVPMVARHIDRVDLAQRRVLVDWEQDW